MAEMYEGMADASVVIQLDVLFVTLTVLTALHAISKRGLFSGIAVVAFIFLHGLAFCLVLLNQDAQYFLNKLQLACAKDICIFLTVLEFL